MSETRYLVYDIHFAGDPHVRGLVVPIPDTVGPITVTPEQFVAMLAGNNHAGLRRYVAEAFASTPYGGRDWFPGDAPVVRTRREIEEWHPDVTPPQGWRLVE